MGERETETGRGGGGGGGRRQKLDLSPLRMSLALSSSSLSSPTVLTIRPGEEELVAVDGGPVEAGLVPLQDVLGLFQVGVPGPVLVGPVLHLLPDGLHHAQQGLVPRPPGPCVVAVAHRVGDLLDLVAAGKNF